LVDIAAAVPVGPFNIVGTVVGLVVFLAIGVGLNISLRLLTGGRYRKPTPRERRWDSALFLFLPIWLVLFAHLGRSYLDRANATAVGIWLYMIGCGLLGFLSVWVWGNFVPAFVSWWLAGFVWVITLWLAFTCRLA
jgi:hypothetical protein